MRKISPDRVLIGGAAIAGIGAAGVVGYYVYVSSSPHRNFWTLAGLISLGVLVIGLAMLTFGLLGPEPQSKPGDQRQAAGDGSVNLQAGRDVHISQHRGE